MSRIPKLNLLVVLILVVCVGTVAHAQDNTTDTSKSDYSKIIEVLEKDPNQSLCVEPVASVDGQVWRASGTSGGLTTSQPSPSSITPYDYEINLNPKIGSTPVAILVVDSFPTGVSTADTFDTIETDMLNKADPWNELDNNRFSHGDLVFSHIVSLLQGTSLVPNADYSVWTQNGASLVYVVKVPAVNYTPGVQITPDSVASAILQAMSDKRNNDQVTQFVVNESFAIIPCIVASNYDAQISFKEYLDEIVNQAQGNLGYPDVTGMTDQENSQNPLHKFTLSGKGEYCQNFQSDIQATFVASSGNSGLDFPFVPAGWDEVIGVTDRDSHNPNGYANAIVAGSSDVDSVSGGWFQFTIPKPGTTPPIAPLNLYYRGTSFSAPTYAVQVALESTAGGSRFAFNPCNGPQSAK